MSEFLQDLGAGKIQFRDKWQFELKSEFFPQSARFESIYTQEFYFFVPNALQINKETYSKEDFYSDLTNFIRYKTPSYSLKELVDPLLESGPMTRLMKLEEDEEVITELKLLGNIFRSSLRDNIEEILVSGKNNQEMILALSHDAKEVRAAFAALGNYLVKVHPSDEVKAAVSYTDEFMSNALDYFVTGLLQELRNKGDIDAKSDAALCSLLLEETERRDAYYHLSLKPDEPLSHDEVVLYRMGLLKKYVMDALELPVGRSSFKELYGTVISSLSAGIAMLVYLLLFVWQGQWFVINSEPFIILTVVAYILKDRLKDGLKSLSYERATHFFSDYSTKIYSPNEKLIIGELREFFTFIRENALPEELERIRNTEFHSVVEGFKRKEQVIFFKRDVKIYGHRDTSKKRLQALSIVLRYNIRDFIEKASDPYHTYRTLDPVTKAVYETRLPKVYHLNVIMKNFYRDEENCKVEELSKFRIILDKDGIKEIDELY